MSAEISVLESVSWDTGYNRHQCHILSLSRLVLKRMRVNHIISTAHCFQPIRDTVRARDRVEATNEQVSRTSDEVMKIQILVPWR